MSFNVYAVRLVDGSEILAQSEENNLDETWINEATLKFIRPRLLIIDPEKGIQGAIPYMSAAEIPTPQFEPAYWIPTQQIISIQIPQPHIETIYLQQTDVEQPEVVGV